jgi:hypothetical protein
MRKSSISRFRKCQVFENLTDSLGTIAWQTRSPSKHRNRGQRREMAPLSCYHTLKPQFNDGQHIYSGFLCKNTQEKVYDQSPLNGVTLHYCYLKV